MGFHAGLESRCGLSTEMLEAVMHERPAFWEMIMDWGGLKRLLRVRLTQ